MEDKIFIAAEFCVDGDENIRFSGYYDPADTYNGWAKPYFTHKEAKRIVDDFNKAEGEKVLEIKHRCIYENGNPMTVKEMILTSKGKYLSVYNLGELGWTWYALYPEESK